MGDSAPAPAKRPSSPTRTAVPPKRPRRSRFSAVPVPPDPDDSGGHAAPASGKDGAFVAKPASSKADDLRARVRAKLAAKEANAAAASKAALPSAVSKHADAVAESRRRAAAVAPAARTEEIARPTESRKTSMFELDAIPIAPVSSLKINQNVAKEKRLKRALKVDTRDIAASQDPEKNPYFDVRVKPASLTRKLKPGFKFLEEGSVAAKAERLREQAALEVVQAELREAATKRVEEAKILALIQPDLPPEPPGVEWWDTPYLSPDTKEYGALSNDSVCFDRVSSLVHHPVPVQLPKSQRDAPVAIPLMLTKKETMKMRHQARVEKQKEAQELVQMGLEAPPPNKVKLSNFMRVLAEEASQDPTKVEAEVRRQVEGRRKEHEQNNEARKKTKEERREQQAKIEEKDREAGLYASVYRVISFDDPRKRFKVDVNAQQCNLSGAIVLHRSCNVVVVEGGAKAQKKFKKLMLRRIDWEDEAPVDNETTNLNVEREENAAGKKNCCVLVWEGIIPKQSFKGFKVIPLPTEDQARSFFRRRKCEQFWDMCRTMPVNDETVGVRVLQ